MGPLSSTGSPMTFMMRPRVSWPTGTMMGAPVSVHPCTSIRKKKRKQHAFALDMVACLLLFFAAGSPLTAVCPKKICNAKPPRRKQRHKNSDLVWVLCWFLGLLFVFPGGAFLPSPDSCQRHENDSTCFFTIQQRRYNSSVDAPRMERIATTVTHEENTAPDGKPELRGTEGMMFVLIPGQQRSAGVGNRPATRGYERCEKSAANANPELDSQALPPTCKHAKNVCQAPPHMTPSRYSRTIQLGAVLHLPTPQRKSEKEGERDGESERDQKIGHNKVTHVLHTEFRRGASNENERPGVCGKIHGDG